MLSSSLSKTTLFFFLVLSNQLYCVLSDTTVAAVATTGEDDEGTTGERLSVSTTDAASGTTGESLSVSTGAFVATAGGVDDSIPVPAPVTGSGNSSSTIDTYWSPNTSTGSVKRQAGYLVTEEISEDGQNYHEIYSGPAVPFSFQATGLKASTVYYFRVFLVGTAGVSGYSTVTAISTLAGSGDAVSSNTTTGFAESTNTTGPANSIGPDAVQGTSQKQGGLSGGVIAGIVIAVIAVVAAIAAVVAKTAFASSAPVAGHWLDSAVQNPLYQAGEQAFENPMYEAPAEAVA